MYEMKLNDSLMAILSRTITDINHPNESKYTIYLDQIWHNNKSIGATHPLATTGHISAIFYAQSGWRGRGRLHGRSIAAPILHAPTTTTPHLPDRMLLLLNNTREKRDWIEHCKVAENCRKTGMEQHHAHHALVIFAKLTNTNYSDNAKIKHTKT